MTTYHNSIQLSQNPIFIVGFPRSGTTLLQSMLATQDNVFSFQETHFFCTTMRFIEKDENGFIKPECLEVVFQNIKEKTDHEFSPDVQSEISDYADVNQLSVQLLFECLITNLLLKQVEADQLLGIQWIEKTPGHIFQIDSIHELYPNARFIEIVRNPLNAIYSWQRIWGRDHTATALAHRWKRGVYTFRHFKKLNPEKAYSVKYEDLVNDSEIEFKKIFEFLGIIPNIEKMDDLQITSSKFVLKTETWKNKNLNNGIMNSTVDYQWALKEKLKIRYCLRQELDEMGYSSGFSLSQEIFNSWMGFISILTKSRFLNRLLKPAKYLVTRMGLRL
jgi:hypothetical protein